MSQFTGLLSATGLGSIQNLGLVLVDNTPNAVDWTIPSSTTALQSIGFNNYQIIERNDLQPYCYYVVCSL